MKKFEFNFLSSDKKTMIYAVKYLPEIEPIGIIQIAHGITEHIGRYEKVCAYFTELGYIVCGNDNIGHGRSINNGKPMYLGPIKSWDKIVADFDKLRQIMTEEYQLPYYFLGFSLGSFLVRTYLIDYQFKPEKVILAGTSYINPLLLSIIMKLVLGEAKKYGEDVNTPLISKLSLESYNKKIKNPSSECDWLCKSKNGLNNYLEDKLCYRKISCELFYDLLYGIKYTCENKNIEKMKKDLPLLLISGAEDPVGDNSKGVLKLAKIYKKKQFTSVDIKLHEGMRHDIFHENDYEKVLDDIRDFIKK